MSLQRLTVLTRKRAKPVVRMGLHHKFAPPASLGHIFVQLDGRGARPQHPSTGGMHVRQVVERQNVSGLEKVKRNHNKRMDIF